MFKKKHLILLLFICSCANLNDSWIELGEGYVYKTDGSDRWITADYVYQDGIYPNVIKYVYDKNFILAIQEPTKSGYKRVLSEDIRGRYDAILFYLKDTTKYEFFGKQFLKSHLWLDSSINKKMREEMLPDNQMSFEINDAIADSLLNNEPYYKKQLSQKKQYWIIDKKMKKVFGPFALQQYQDKRIELKAPNSLILKNN